MTASVRESGEGFWWQLPFEEPFNSEQREIHDLLLQKSQQTRRESSSAHYKETLAKGASELFAAQSDDGTLGIQHGDFYRSSNTSASTQHFNVQDDMTEELNN